MKLTLGIFAHIDAGKTTLTERLLLEAGVLRALGSVDEGTGFTDFLEIERRRGISVRSATVVFSVGDTEINLIDTPGHADFSEETELALSAVDLAVLVVSAREGIESRTERLLRLMKERDLPFLVFVNKCDLEGVSRENMIPDLQRSLPKASLVLPDEFSEEFRENAACALDDEALLDGVLNGSVSDEALFSRLVSAFSDGALIPVLFGSAKTGEGVSALLRLLTKYRFPADEEAPLSAFVYKVEHRKNLGKLAHVRLFSGRLSVRDETVCVRTNAPCKVSQIKRARGEKLVDVPALCAGETGAVLGLDVRAGDFLGVPPARPALSEFTPYLRVKIEPNDKDKLQELRTALEELTEESPSLALEWHAEKRELTVSAAGTVQTEVLKETLAQRGLSVGIGAPSVIYRETPARSAYGFEAYTMPKPCWAVVKFLIEPLPRGSGLVYRSVVSEKKIAYRYQEHVKTAIPRALEQGLHGWQVTDLKVTLVDGEHHFQHTHPLDFFTATPMGIMDGLRNAGTVLLEPVLSVRICAPETAFGKLSGELLSRRGHADPPRFSDGKVYLTADVPAEESFDLPERVASLTGGRTSCETELKGYFPCPEGHGADRERIGVNPLDRSLWILHCRGAYKA